MSLSFCANALLRYRFEWKMFASPIQFQFELKSYFFIQYSPKAPMKCFFQMFIDGMKLPSLHKRIGGQINYHDFSKHPFFKLEKKLPKYLETIQEIGKLFNTKFLLQKQISTDLRHCWDRAKCRNAINQVAVVKMGVNCQRELLPWTMWKKFFGIFIRCCEIISWCWLWGWQCYSPCRFFLTTLTMRKNCKIEVSHFYDLNTIYLLISIDRFFFGIEMRMAMINRIEDRYGNLAVNKLQILRISLHLSADIYITFKEFAWRLSRGQMNEE